jgi:hypothetical protein
MLNIPQLAQIKARDPYAYEALQALQAAVNSLARLVGVDPSGNLTPPAAIGGISVSANGGVADISITDNSAVTKAIRYSSSMTLHRISRRPMSSIWAPAGMRGWRWVD